MDEKGKRVDAVISGDAGRRYVRYQKLTPFADIVGCSSCDVRKDKFHEERGKISKKEYSSKPEDLERRRVA